MNRINEFRGFTLLGLIIAVAAITLLAGGGLYMREWKSRQSTLQIGNEAVKRAEDLKKMIESRVPTPSPESSFVSSSDEIFCGKEAEKLCGPQPPADCGPEYNCLGCRVSDKKWGCYKVAVESLDTSTWKTYRNEEYGFEFRHPAEWRRTINDWQGQESKIVTRFVNPIRAGKPDTDVPIEQFIVSIGGGTCEGQTINIGGIVWNDSGWEQGFGLIYYRDLCLIVMSWQISLDISAYDEASQSIMDSILSTFKFIP